MAEHTGIEWTDATFNPWIGCMSVSLACDHCYAKTLVERWGGDFSARRRTSAANWKQPLRWNSSAEKAATRRRVFCSSLADVFDNRVPLKWRTDLWAMIRATPWLQWQLLTKRPQNIAKMLPPDWGHGFHNVWLGTTVENQTEADRRIPHLIEIPASIKFLSCEPLLGPIKFAAVPGFNKFNLNLCNWWVICGGESGRGARPMHPVWARSVRDQCAAAGVPFFFKQWGEWAPDDNAPDAHTAMNRIGKKAAGSLLDGREHKAFPA
jgi:protein gp37